MLNVATLLLCCYYCLAFMIYAYYVLMKNYGLFLVLKQMIVEIKNQLYVFYNLF